MVVSLMHRVTRRLLILGDDMREILVSELGGFSAAPAQSNYL